MRSLAAASLGVAVGRRADALESAAPHAGEIFIRGGRVVNADGSRDADVRIVGETIAEIGAGLSPGANARVIEASGHLVMPGGIDPHTHLHPPFADDLTSGGQAALRGGITTVGTFAFPGDKESPLDALERATRQAGEAAVSDMIYHGVIWPPTPEGLAAVPAFAERGQPSLKVFMPQKDFHANLDGMIALLEAARRSGVVTMVHCEDEALLDAAVRRLTAANRTSLASYGESRPVIAEVAATQLAASLCESTGAPMHVVHLSSARALDATRSARQKRLPLYVETRPLYLHLTEEKMQGADAPLFVGQPPLRTKADSDALWQGLADGSIDILATDHAPWTRAQKMDATLTITKLRPGVSDLCLMLPMYFSEGVGKRGMSPERFVATTSTNAARIFGLYPAKGVVREGATADVVIWDPKRAHTVRGDEDPSRSDYTVYEGWEVTGWPIVTVRRGEVVYENGRMMLAPGSGRVPRRTPWSEQAFPTGTR